MTLRALISCDFHGCVVQRTRNVPAALDGVDLGAWLNTLSRDGWCFAIDRMHHPDGATTELLVASYCPAHASEAREIKRIDLKIVGFEVGSGKPSSAP